MTYRRLALAATLAALTVLPAFAADSSHEAKLRQLAEADILSWAQQPTVVEAIKQQNAKHATLTDADIQRLDQQWRAEAKGSGGPLSSGVLANDLSKRLKQVKAQHKGLFSEIFVMDNRGLNVGQSDMTSDYWQGDEAKWQKTFSVGPKVVFVDEVKMDESSQVLQSQVSVSIVDPATNAVIGAVTVGVNVAELPN
jgi:hypothetical protein